MEKLYFVYIMASKSRVLYTGITSQLRTRVWKHKTGFYEGFSSKYKCTRLVYFESFGTPQGAIAREKQIKGWLRCKKVAVIEADNPTWEDLAAEWFEPPKAGPSLAKNARSG